MQKHKKGALQKRQTFPVANSTTSGVLSTVLAVEVVVIELVVVLTARGLIKKSCADGVAASGGSRSRRLQLTYCGTNHWLPTK